VGEGYSDMAMREKEGKMTKRNYWLDLFTGVTWQEFEAAGGPISPFHETRVP
jgi:hypothetical protein